jgi:hypothetical protein
VRRTLLPEHAGMPSTASGQRDSQKQKHSTICILYIAPPSIKSPRLHSTTALVLSSRKPIMNPHVPSCRYRGAAPVQRCLQAGDAVGGVSVAFTVQRCDAGPVLAQEQVLVCGVLGRGEKGEGST